ncbi:MAG: hypothetical protein NC347_14570 [Clostridium sp.]|nr:hypothetical protein [Clostridium sp.]
MNHRTGCKTHLTLQKCRMSKTFDCKKRSFAVRWLSSVTGIARMDEGGSEK